ncbi:MAG: lyase family protein, partial [Gemmatimonadales bacterium]
ARIVHALFDSFCEVALGHGVVDGATDDYQVAARYHLGGDFERVKELDQRVASRLGFARSIPVSGQTYTRKLDSTLLDLLAGVAQTASKIGNDLRLLQHEGEVFEPFETGQVGSSAMPYKRNPMRAERICSLARYVMSLRESTGHTMATQWFERTLDDSANRRLVLPDSFLAIDAILILLVNVSSGLDVRPATVARNVREVMPFMATERWLMAGVKHGGDRQTLHNVIRRHAIEVKDAVERGEPNNLVDRLAQDPAFAGLDGNTMKEQLEPSLYVGAAPLQVDAFLANEIGPLLKDLRSFRFEDDAAVTV